MAFPITNSFIYIRVCPYISRSFCNIIVFKMFKCSMSQSKVNQIMYHKLVNVSTMSRVMKMATSGTRGHFAYNGGYSSSRSYVTTITSIDKVYINYAGRLKVCYLPYLIFCNVFMEHYQTR